MLDFDWYDAKQRDMFGPFGSIARDNMGARRPLCQCR